MIVYPPITPTTSRKVNVSNNTTASSGSNVVSSSSTNVSTSRLNNSSSVSSNKRQTQIQWRSTNVQQGVIKVDSQQLYSLLKTEPIEKYYELDEEPFAQGAFASVRRVRSRESGQVYAAKFSSRTRYGEDSTAEIYHEIALLSLCSPSPRIVKLHDVFQTSQEIIIVMEFAPGGDMQTIIDDNVVPFEADVVRFVQHVVEGLAYLHHRKIAHLDIKPQNLVMMGDFPDCAVKVCDFEISRVILDGTQIRELLGTPEYVAPEILHYEPITLAADMWSLGVTVYVLLTGFSPFGGETDQETFLNISQARLDFPEELFEDVSEDAIDFIKKLLVRNPRERMTAKECLRHPWLANNKKKSSTKKTVMQTESTRGGRAGCSSCSSTNYHHQNLRKYLSKSREALFERVISKHKQHSLEQQTGQNLRKSTLLSQYDKTKRMCESQMSLVSKSRERLMQGSMSPSITKSREKLYGIKCLSKSHEVLNLCKTVSALASSSDNKKPLEGLLKTLTRAATASGDLISDNNSEKINNNFIEIDENSVDENQTKIPDQDSSQTVNNNDSSIVIDDKIKKTQEKETVVASLPVPLISDYQPLQTVLTILRSNNNNSSDIQTNNIIENIDDDKENFISTKVDDNKEVTNIKSPENPGDKVSCDSKKSDETKTASEVKENKLTVQRPKLFIMKQLSVISSEGDDLNSPAISQSDSLSLTEGNSTSDSDTSEEDHTGSLERITGDISSGDDDEPRFTVKQLISAYNMHQEIVTKTSLEVTMNTPKTEEKILPVIDKVPNQKFPTGANALRLFIPDLYITKSKRSSRRKHSTKKEDDRETEQQIQELKPENNDESEKDKSNEIENNEKSNEHIETKENQEKTNSKISENNYAKKNSLTAENIPVIYNRSSSLSSEISNDKTSGISSTMTSCEDILTSSDNQKKPRSNRSSGVISLDGDNIAEETPISSDNTKKISISNRSSGVITSDNESQTENTVTSIDVPSKIPKSNRSSGVLSVDAEIITENIIGSSDNTRRIPRSNRSSAVISSDSENIAENSNDSQQRQRKISKTNRSSSIMSSDGENNLEINTTSNQRQRKVSRTNRTSGLAVDGDNIEESKSSNDTPRKISRSSRTSSENQITCDDSSNEIPKKSRSNRSSRVESFNGETIVSDVTSSSGDNQRKISRSNRSSGILSSDGENIADDLNSTSNIPRIIKSNRSSRTESIDGENNEMITSNDIQQLKKIRSKSQISNDINNVTDILNKTSTTSSNIKSSEKTLCTGTPRLNRKSFPCSRSSSNTLVTEKTRRKSNPAMKPPFY